MRSQPLGQCFSSESRYLLALGSRPPSLPAKYCPAPSLLRRMDDGKWVESERVRGGSAVNWFSLVPKIVSARPPTPAAILLAAVEFSGQTWWAETILSRKGFSGLEYELWWNMFPCIWWQYGPYYKQRCFASYSTLSLDLQSLANSWSSLWESKVWFLSKTKGYRLNFLTALQLR